MDSYSNLLTIAAVSLLAAISPGPDFCIVVRNSLSFSRKSGLLTALGVSLALMVHLFYTLVGIGVLIAESPVVYTLLKYTGVGYLFYLGLNSLLASFKNAPRLELEYADSFKDMPPLTALRQGFLTNLLNPKAALFFISLFAQLIDIHTPLLIKLEYAFINWSIGLAWFLALVFLITSEGIIKKISHARLYIDRVMGSALMLLGLKLLIA
ncbi:MAG: amino acid transporter [Parachlamydia sp.]|nr:MAG: amino acid transporter [Parachlamydia sp.]